MRILFATTRGAGHVGPLTPFAHACIAAGHEVLFAGEFARSALPGLLKLARRWGPDLIVRETCEFASPLVAETVGVPDVHVACFLAVLGTSDWDLYEPLSRLRREFGLAPRQ